MSRLFCLLGWHRGVTIRDGLVLCGYCGKVIDRLPDFLCVR